MMMNFKTILDGAKVVGKWAVKHAPQLLTIAGVGAMAGATVHAVVESPKAKEELDAIENDPELTHKEYISAKAKTIFKHYWPTALLTIGGAGMIFGGHHINVKRLGVATALLSTRTEELKKLEQKVLEHDGEKTLEKYKDEITNEEVKREAKKQGITDLSTVYNTGKGTTLCFDPIGKRFFLSDLEFIRQMRDEMNNDISEQMQKMKEAVMSLNDWYGYIELPPLNGRVNGHKMGPDIGKDLGWRNRTMQLRFTSGMLENDQTYVVVGFTDNGAPKIDPNICDDYGSHYEDDETDMPWRGQ